MNPICIYHKADLDGVCSAAIVKRFVPGCELYGIDYGEEFPWDKACEGATDWVIVGGEVQDPPIKERRTVYMVDFSLPVADMKRLAGVSNLVWIDHHKTAIEAMTGTGGYVAYLRTDLSACELCWDALSELRAIETGDFSRHTPGTVPEAVRLLGAYDSWRKDDPEWDSKIMPFQYGVRSIDGIYDPESSLWRDVFDDDAVRNSGIVAAGYAILNFQAQQNRKIAEAGAFETRFELHEPNWTCAADVRDDLARYRLLCLNTPLNSSASFDSVWDPEKHDVMVAFRLGANRKWKFSLYSLKPEIDCGAIAKSFGGGGHKGAAGFVCDQLPWE